MSGARLDYRLAPGGALTGHAGVPGDKSISHRAVLLGGIAEGATRISGFLEGEDTLATLAAFESMGVAVERAHGEIAVHGRGRHGLEAPRAPLDLGNSGTGMRLLAGLLAGQRFDCTLSGDASLSRRPMDRIIEPLTRMGARIQATAGGTAPLVIRGGAALTGIRYELPVASAQVKSSLLLAGLYARGRTGIVEPAPTRDHTERMLSGFGYEVTSRDGEIGLAGGGRLRGCELTVPGDLSSAAFLLVGASIAPGSRVLLEGVGVNPTRDGVLRILEGMGARIERRNLRDAGGEPVADLAVEWAPLRGIDVPPEWVSLAIDEFPALMIAAAAAEGTTTVRGAGELRVKESDRIAAMAAGLTRMGVRCETAADGITVHGGGLLRAARVESFGDHRVAMAFAIAALRADGEVVVADCANVATSFPGFVARAHGLGLGIAEDAGR